MSLTPINTNHLKKQQCSLGRCYSSSIFFFTAHEFKLKTQVGEFTTVMHFPSWEMTHQFHDL